MSVGLDWLYLGIFPLNIFQIFQNSSKSLQTNFSQDVVVTYNIFSVEGQKDTSLFLDWKYFSLCFVVLYFWMNCLSVLVDSVYKLVPHGHLGELLNSFACNQTLNIILVRLSGSNIVIYNLNFDVKLFQEFLTSYHKRKRNFLFLSSNS